MKIYPVLIGALVLGASSCEKKSAVSNETPPPRERPNGSRVASQSAEAETKVGEVRRLKQKPLGRATPEVPVAKSIPGKSGFVFSPFNNKIVDVQGIPGGTLVADPSFPANEQKYFRLPEDPPIKLLPIVPTGDSPSDKQ